jgi:hypothetical protein
MQSINSVLSRMCNEVPRRALDVLRQEFDGGVSVMGEGEFLESSMFGRDIAVVIVSQHPAPASVQLGAIPQGLGHGLESIVAATGQQSPVKFTMVSRPVFIDRLIIVNERGSVQYVVCGDDPLLPLHIAALESQAQRHRLNLHAGLGEVSNIPYRQVSDSKAPLRAGDDEALLRQAGECLAHYGLTHTELGADLDHPQLLAGGEKTVEKIGPKHIMDLFGAGPR